MIPNINISPTPEQSYAIQSIVAWYGQKGCQEFYLAGYAGVGKSTIAALAIEEIKTKYKKVKKIRVGAYTGKAASVLRKKGNENAQTIQCAITTHKAQGSSWPHVTIIDDSNSFRENQTKWLYTALTRAETGLTLLVRPS